MFVRIRHIDLAATHQTINQRSKNTEEQAGAHACRCEQQRAEQYPHRGGENDGNPGAMGGYGSAVHHQLDYNNLAPDAGPG